MKEQSYKDYSITELREALFNIDAKEYPERLKEINDWLKIRLEENPDFDKNSVYIGFWLRFIASVLDSLFLFIVVFLSVRFFGIISENKELFGSLLNFTYVLIFWIWFSATLGKMALGIVIVDEKTGLPPKPHQFILRYLGYYISAIPLMIGFLWAIWHPKKRTWHDIISGTVVVGKGAKFNDS